MDRNKGNVLEFQYTACQDGISLDKVTDPDQLVVIPEELDGKPVVMLGAYALSQAAVEEIHLPGTLKKIGAYAFYNCDRLKLSGGSG